MNFTGIPEVDINILDNLSDKELSSACQLNRYVSTLCNRDDLWQTRIEHTFGLQNKSENITWKDYYFYLVNKFLVNAEFNPPITPEGYNLRLLQLLKDNNYKYFDWIVVSAGEYGHSEVLKWIAKQNIVYPSTIANIAIQYRLNDLLKWLEQYNIYPDVPGLNTLARRGDLEALKYYARLGLLPDSNGAYYAEDRDHANVLNWLAKRGIYPW
jgi:hypothetical protein